MAAASRFPGGERILPIFCYLRADWPVGWSVGAADVIDRAGGNPNILRSTSKSIFIDSLYLPSSNTNYVLKLTW